MSKWTLGFTGLQKAFGRDYGIAEPYWGALSYEQKTRYWVSTIKEPWSYSLIFKKILEYRSILEKKVTSDMPQVFKNDKVAVTKVFFNPSTPTMRNRRLQNVADSIADVTKSVWTETLIQNTHKPSG